MSCGPRLNLEYLRKVAKRFQRSLQASDPDALADLSHFHPKYLGIRPVELGRREYSLHDAQLVVARRRGFASWPAMLAFIGDGDPRLDNATGLTSDQLRRFEEHGYVRLPDAIGRKNAIDMERFIWKCLGKLHGIVEIERSTWSKPAPWVGLKRFKREAVFAPTYQGLFRDVCDQLLGPTNWSRPTSSGGFLVSFPSCKREQWEIPGKAWHVDAHFTYPPNQLFGIRTFAYVSDVPPRSGGTLVVRGSHQLVKQFVASLTEDQRRKRFSVLCDEFTTDSPWFDELCNGTPHGAANSSTAERTLRFSKRPFAIDGVPVQVEELCGAQGDLFIVHPWLLHTRAPHAGERPRFVLTKVVFAERSGSS